MRSAIPTSAPSYWKLSRAWRALLVLTIGWSCWLPREARAYSAGATSFGSCVSCHTTQTPTTIAAYVNFSTSPVVGSSLTISLGPDTGTFQGFAFQVSSGTLTSSNGSVSVGAGGNWVTHTAATVKSSVSFTWTPATAGIMSYGLYLLDTGGNRVSSSAMTGNVVVLKARGSACSDDGESCEDGHCVDGVCCDTACGSGAEDDCMACSNPLTGTTAGSCAALKTALAPLVICRGAQGGCDLAESCTNASTNCPADARVPNGTTCRAAANDCDEEEACDGVELTCPSDTLKSAGAACGNTTTTECTDPDSCNGAGDCLPNHLFDGASCSNGICGAGLCLSLATDAGVDAGSSAEADAGLSDGGFDATTSPPSLPDAAGPDGSVINSEAGTGTGGAPGPDAQVGSNGGQSARDAQIGSDAGSIPDAATTSTDSGCGCSLPGTEQGAGISLWLVPLGLLLLQRRRAHHLR